MKKVKSIKEYKYDYPENRALERFIRRRDLPNLKKITGYSYSHLRLIFLGERRMPPIVLEEFLKMNPEASGYSSNIPVIRTSKRNPNT